MSKPRIIKGKNTRVSIAVICGIIAAIISGVTIGWNYAPLIGWDILASMLLVLLWMDLHGHTSEQTAVIAKRDDMSHNILDIILTLACIASLGGVVSLVMNTTQSNTIAQISSVALGLVSVIIAWATIHAMYMVHYAALYYRHAKGCIDFGEATQPTFTDFAYLAFTIGMTYQVSDTTLKTTDVRGVAIRHALLSFLFGTAIIATTINALASLGK